MTQPVLLRENFWAIGYTNYDKNFQIVGKYLNYKTRFGRGYSCILPPGSWQIICTTKMVRSDQAAEVVEYIVSPMVRGYRDYEAVQSREVNEAVVGHAIDSFRSLLRSVNLNPDNNYLILKKQ